MKNVTRHTGELHIIEQLATSANGNPRYLIQVDGFTCRTAVDSMYGYLVRAYDGKKVTATIGTHYGKATLNSVENYER